MKLITSMMMFGLALCLASCGGQTGTLQGSDSSVGSGSSDQSSTDQSSDDSSADPDESPVVQTEYDWLDGIEKVRPESVVLTHDIDGQAYFIIPKLYLGLDFGQNIEDIDYRILIDYSETLVSREAIASYYEESLEMAIIPVDAEEVDGFDLVLSLYWASGKNYHGVSFMDDEPRYVPMN